MQARELSIPDLWEFTPQQFGDSRGAFLVWYDAEVFTKSLGYGLRLAQTNHSVSRAGVVRGVHWADVPPGQGKYVYCPKGALLDIVVDIRVGSPTFGQHEVVRLDSADYRAVYVAPGLGHSFVALEDDTAMAYVCEEGYRPSNEHTLNALDPALGLPWPTDLERVMSDRDADAPTLAEVQTAGGLPSYDECQDYYRRLRETA